MVGSSIFFKFIYFERERAQLGEGQKERERERKRENPKLTCAVSVEPDMGLNPMNAKIMT